MEGIAGKTPHTVVIDVADKKFIYSSHCVHAWRGDQIVWKLKKRGPFSIVVKAPVSPLSWSSAVSAGGEPTITAIVRADAAEGCYPYAVSVVDGGELLVDDPEIIIRPPDRRG